ncbi:hypothetical protein [Thermus sp. PS18]|uniref:hypothetical protein n=1 Tax=Thermus sp. PS18 TaxID=2849039 RepID=UPI003A5C8829
MVINEKRIHRLLNEFHLALGRRVRVTRSVPCPPSPIPCWRSFCWLGNGPTCGPSALGPLPQMNPLREREPEPFGL